jgi:cysteine dioxygenase
MEVNAMEQVTMEQLTIDEWAKQLCAIPKQDFTIPRVMKFAREKAIRPETLAPYLFYAKSHYTRNLIYKCELFEVLAICWNVGQVSRIHNHRDQNCWMAVPLGRLQVENFHLVDQDLAAGRSQLEPLNTVEMNIAHPCAVDPADPVHRVINPREFNERAVSLHVYSRPFDTCVVYSPEQGTCGEIKLHFTTEYGKPK